LKKQNKKIIQLLSPASPKKPSAKSKPKPKKSISELLEFIEGKKKTPEPKPEAQPTQATNKPSTAKNGRKSSTPEENTTSSKSVRRALHNQYKSICKLLRTKNIDDAEKELAGYRMKVSTLRVSKNPDPNPMLVLHSTQLEQLEVRIAKIKAKTAQPAPQPKETSKKPPEKPEKTQRA